LSKEKRPLRVEIPIKLTTSCAARRHRGSRPLGRAGIKRGPDGRSTTIMHQIAVTAAVLTIAVLATLPGEAQGASKAGVKKAVFGKLEDGTVVNIYTLTNTNGAQAKIITYGAILTELHVPDKSGAMGDVVLGFDNLDQYVKGHPYFGATVGRF